ncbi:MAG TPA: formate/nitrite transporter family protein [Nitrospiraceae bacterium]|nr:formate/nitrite transporter family protein [Nitrospiraceae bacterium]
MPDFILDRKCARLSRAGRSVQQRTPTGTRPSKILATVFPITAFVACGFEHSVANMYFLPIGVALAGGTSAPLSVADAVSNLALVTLGNVLGGTILVALVYWLVYLRSAD